jgi:outer membrane protein assembly factor BamA
MKSVFPFFLLFFILIIFSVSFCNAHYSQTDSIKSNPPNYYIIKQINLTGNKVTRESIIFRELMFKINDTIDSKKLDDLLNKSRNNLQNTSLFNFVTINKVISDSNYVTVNIEVLERWYIWPVPIIELSFRNFNTWWKTKEIERLNYGFSLVNNNFRGRKETFSMLIRYGYDELYTVNYQIPYINKKETIGLGFTFGINRDHEIPYETLRNKLEYFKNTADYPLTKIFTSALLTSRPDIYNTHTFEFDYFHYNFNDSINKLNPDFSPEHNNPEFFGLHYKFKNDFRDNKPYPLSGHYFDIDIYKWGLYFETKVPDLLFIHSSYDKYLQISKKFYFAASLTGGYADKKEQPYYLSTGVGYGHDNIRGYDYYVINGQYFGIYKMNFKYELLPTHVHDFKFIPTEKFSKVHYAFYLNLFADAGYVYDDHFYPQNVLANSFLYSGGIGLDFITYYDKVIRFEYTLNKQGQTGIFINFVAPI